MTLSSFETDLAVGAMARRLTAPFARGADNIELQLMPGVTTDELIVTGYDFTEHRARYGPDPVVSYVFSARESAPLIEQLSIRIVDPAAGTVDVVVPVPGGVSAGESYPLAMPAGFGSDARIQSIRGSGGGAPTEIATSGWTVVALLGTLARLLWVLGAESDQLDAVRRRVQSERLLSKAGGRSLDLIGTDLHVPRFPPMPYSVLPDTIALYHLDDFAGASPAVADAAAAFPGRTPHHGILVGSPRLGASGRYGSGVELRAGDAVTIADHPDFDIDASSGFTLDCFLRPDSAVATTTGTVAERHDGTSGWRLEVGDVGLGIPGGVRAVIEDGSVTLNLVAATRLPSDRFSHLAITLTRDPARPDADAWSILLDGTPVATTSAVALGAVAPAADLVIGHGGTGFAGILDELHVRSVGSTAFHPVLGEDDEQYRRRLSVFRRWILPTPQGMQDALNGLVPEIAGVSEPLVVEDVDGTFQRGSRLVRVWPSELAAPQGIVGTGQVRGAGEDPWPAAEPFDADLLGRHHHSQITYLPAADDPLRPAHLAAANPQLMQPATAAALDRLVDILAAQGIAGSTIIEAGFDQSVEGSQSAGRAVLMRHTAISMGRLAALAHRAGFDYVENRIPAMVYAATAPSNPFLLGPTGSSELLHTNQIPEVVVGTPVVISVAHSTATYDAPALPADVVVNYWLVPTGAGRASLSPGPGTTTTLDPTHPGVLGLSADIRRGHRVVTVSGAVRIIPATMNVGDTIAADGSTGVDIDTVGPVETGFDPGYLMVHDDPRIDYGSGADNHRMQRHAGALLTALADLFQTEGSSSGLQVRAAYDPTASPNDLAAVGRLLRLRHAGSAIRAVAIRAHRSGFDYVRATSTDVIVAAQRGDLIELSGPDEVEVGATITLNAAPGATDIGPTARLGWSSGQVYANGLGINSVALTGPIDPTVVVRGEAPGVGWVLATLRDADTAGPYVFTVRRRAAVASAQISRSDYYLIMNALNTLHPIGVEVRTEDIRAAVVELGSAPSGLAPAFTYPPFRLRRPVPIRRDHDETRSL